MNRVKFTALWMAAMMTAGILGGCGEAKSMSAEEAASTAAQLESLIDDIRDETLKTADETEQAAESLAGYHGTEIKEQVLLDVNDVTITATEFTENSDYSDSLHLRIENNGAEDIGIGVEAVIVNNYMMNSFDSFEVAAGKTANETIDFVKSDLVDAEIFSVGQIEVQFYLYDTETYEPVYTSDMATIQTSEYADMKVQPADEGTELYNADNVRIVGKEIRTDDDFGTELIMYLENKTDHKLIVQADLVSVNDVMIDPAFSCTLYPGKMAVSAADFLNDELRENGISEVERVEISFRIVDADTYETITTSDAATFTES